MDEEFGCLSPIDDHSVEVCKKKRARASNFTSHEEDILMSLVENHSKVLENKETNAVTWQDKKNAWDQITTEFGAQSQCARSAKHLKDKYDNMKRKAKTNLSFHKNQLYKTGGGTYSSKITNTDERIASLLGKSATGLSNNIDSDACKNLDEIIEIDFLESEFDGTENSKSVEQIDDKANVWSKWKPSSLKKPKCEKLQLPKKTLLDKNDNLLQKQVTFFENEDKRAEERHNFQIKEFKLKEEFLQLEIALKKIEINRLQDKHMYSD